MVKHDFNFFFFSKVQGCRDLWEELNTSFIMLVLRNTSALHIKAVLPVNVESIFPKFWCMCWLISWGERWESWLMNHRMSMWSGLGGVWWVADECYNLPWPLFYCKGAFLHSNLNLAHYISKYVCPIVYCICIWEVLPVRDWP